MLLARVEPAPPLDERRYLLVELIDELLLEGGFEEVDQYFKILSSSFMTDILQQLSLGLALLMVTIGAEDKLPTRKVFLTKLECRLRTELTEEEVESHLYGLI